MHPARRLTCFTALAGLLTAGTVQAQVGSAPAESDLDLEFRAGLNWTDNLGREPDGESETFASLGTSVAFARESARFRASLTGALDYFHYDSDRFDNEVVGRIDGLLGFSLVPQRVDWMFENSFGQVRTDPFAPAGPGNREYLNVFGTGPDLYMPLGARTTLGGSARYVDRRWQDSDQLDSEILGGEVRVTRLLSPTQQLGLTAATRSIDYDSDALPNYEVHSAYISYQRQLATGEVGLDVGANRLQSAGRSDTGLLLRANWTRELTARSTLRLAAGREFQDAGDQLGVDSIAQTGFGPTGETGLTSDPYVLTFASVRYTLDQERATFSVGGGWDRERYDSSTLLDRDALFADAGVSYRFTPLLSGDLRVSLRREEFDNIANGTADELTVVAALARRLGRELDLRLEYQYAQRDGDVGLDFEENRASVLLVWLPGRR